MLMVNYTPVFVCVCAVRVFTLHRKAASSVKRFCVIFQMCFRWSLVLASENFTDDISCTLMHVCVVPYFLCVCVCSALKMDFRCFAVVTECF